jgi:hypothetical protein
MDELAILERESLSPPKTQKEKWLYLWTWKHEKTFNNSLEKWDLISQTKKNKIHFTYGTSIKKQ